MTYYIKCTLKNKKKEARGIFSCTFNFDRKRIRELRPGRFVMVWLPGIDEFPLSPSNYDPETCTVRLTFKVRGIGTQTLSAINVGDAIFIRGPYGNGFKVPRELAKENDKPVLIAGGGVGLAPLMPLIKDLLHRNIKLHVICGFRSFDEAFFIDEIADLLENNFTISTDDGSMGIKGTVVDVAKELLRRKTFSYVYACGPEIMLFKLHKMLLNKRVPHQMLVERYIKCALGVCGSCIINGFRLCKEGPVFNDVKLKKMKEFGRYKRNASGVRELIS